MPQGPESGGTPPRPPGNAASSQRWLFIVFILGIGLLFGLRMFFSGLQEELRDRSANEQARLFIGEEIVYGITRIETNIYKMTTASNAASFGRARRAIDAQINKLRHDLKVLEQGGVVQREIRLNIEGRDEMVREVTYRIDAKRKRYVMELIEIAPLLDDISQKMQGLQELQTELWAMQDQANKAGFFDLHERFDVFLKGIPPYFERLDENANRLFYDSSEKLKTLKQELQVQSSRLQVVEVALVVLVLTLTSLGAWLFLRRIGQAHKELGVALDEMRTARDAAEKASRAKSEFVSRMSHELRTPLNAIIGFADLLQDEPLGPSQRNYVELINGSGKHLLELINAVLDHAKIEAGGLTLERIPVDLLATIEAVNTIAGEGTAAKGLKFVSHIAPDLPRFIVGDPTRLRQVLINLLNNAVKFTEQGSVELRAATEDGKLVFSVRDSGIGMDAAARARLFKPFSQADDSVTRRFGGTGLGLIISRELVEAMGGYIEVESAPGVGTVFWVWLPLEVAAMPQSAGDAAPPLAHRDVAVMIPGRVLVVDDNRVNQQLARAMLDRMHLPHDLADNGEDALRQLETTSYALVLMDMEMPVMDGVTATMKIRAREAEQGLPRLPIIAMTANALQEDRERCMTAGMDGFIAKPIGLAALEKELQALFAGTGKAGASPAPCSVCDTTPVIGAPAFDRASALASLGDDEELFRQLADMFIADAPNSMGELDAGLAAADAMRLTRSAHTLKGLFATFVAAPGQAAALKLEQMAKKGDLANCGPEVAIVKGHIEALCAALRD